MGTLNPTLASGLATPYPFRDMAHGRVAERGVQCLPWVLRTMPEIALWFRFCPYGLIKLSNLLNIAENKKTISLQKARKSRKKEVWKVP